MALLPILIWPDARLKTPCSPATPGDATRQLAADMLETMYDAPGRGLAAPQVDAMIRLFVMDATWKTGLRSPRVFLNPEILSQSDDTAIGPEGCLSIPGVTAHVRRATSITLRWTDPEGAGQQETLTGFAAICAQHEMDHLNGIVMLNHLSAQDRALAEAAFT